MVETAERSSELTDLTVSMLLSLIFFAAVFWVFPLIPVAITLMVDLPFSTFVSLWMGGLPVTGIAFYYVFKARE